MARTALRPIRKEGDGRTYSYNRYSYKYYGYGGYHREKRPRQLNKSLLCATVLFLVTGGTALYFWHDYQLNRLSDALLAHGDEMAVQENWRGASDAYYRVWKIRQAPDVLGKFTPAYDKMAVTYNRAGVIGSYQRAVGVLPDRIDLRNRLSELLLTDGQHKQALDQAIKTLAQAPDDQAAHKWRALALLELRRSGKPVESINVLDELKQAFQRQTSDFDLALRLINFMRVDLKAPNESELAREADAVMDQLVAAAPNNPNAYLARYQYRTKYGLGGAKADMDRAVSLSPENPIVIHQAGWDALREAESENSTPAYLTARQLFSNLIKLQPNSPSGYLGLGDTEYLVRGDIDEAIRVWQEGLQNAGASVPLLLRVAEGEIVTFRYDAAEETLQQLNDLRQSLIGKQSEADRNWAVASSSLFQAKIHLARQQPVEAIAHLETAARLGDDARPGIRDGKSTAFTALVELGITYAKLGHKQFAAQSFDRALTIKPDSETALIRGAEAWANLGNLDRAIRNVERALRLSNVSKEANLYLAGYLLERQLAIPQADRDWSEFETAFETARSQLANSWKLRLLDVDYSIRVDGGDDLSRTLGKLLSIEQDFPNNVEVWRRLPFVYEAIGQSSDANRTLNQLEAMTSSSPATKLLLVDILLGRGQVADAQTVLDGISAEQLTPFERWSRDLAMLRVCEASGDSARIDTYLSELCDEYPQNRVLLERQLDRRLAGASMSDSPSTRDLIAQLKERQTGSDGTWLYYEARLELAAAQPDMDLVRAHMASLRNELTYWSRTQELAGRKALAENNDREARIAFADALTKPNPNPELLQLVVARGLEDSDFLSVIQLIQQQRQLAPLSRLLQEGHWLKLQRTLDLAMVDGGITGQTDAQRLAWSELSGRRVDIEQYRIEHPNDVAGLMFALHRIEKGDEAGRLSLLEVIKSQEFESEDLRSFVIGQALHLAGDSDGAIDSFEHVSETSDLRLAAELYAGHSKNSVKTQKPDEIVSSDVQLAKYSTRRLEAILKLRRSSRDDLNAARQLLQSLVDSAAADINDRILLSACLEQLGDTSAAKAQLLEVVEAEPTARHLSVLVGFLLRAGENDEAKAWIEQLEDQTGWSRKSVSLRTRWLSATNRHNEIEPFVEEYARRIFGSTQSDIPLDMRAIASIYREVNMIPQAKRWLSLLASRYPNQDEPLSLLLVENDESERAIQRCVNQLEEAPSAETATLLARVLVYGEVADSTLQTAMPLLKEALDQSPHNPALLFAVGNLQLKLGDTDAAISLLRRVTEIQPGHYLAWNNLAALLAEQDGREDEAMNTIDQAIGYAAYEIPTLLDTKAVVLIHQERYREAVELLRDKVTKSRSATDPRFYFHLAMALDKLDENDAARESLSQADDLDLDLEFLTELEHRELQLLRTKQGGN